MRSRPLAAPSTPSSRACSTNELAARWRDHGDTAAREALIHRYLPLARRLAGRYANAHEPLDDLVQVACLGLVGAVDRFDPHRGTGFAGFAIPTILGELKRYFRNTGWSAHVHRSAQEMALRVDQATKQITARRGRAPAVEELARYLEVRPADVLDALDASNARYAASLDAPVTQAHEEVATLGDTIGRIDSGFGLVDTATSLAAGIARLPSAERRALTMRLTREIKQVEIAQELGCSQMQVSRLLRRAAARLREFTDPHSR